MTYDFKLSCTLSAVPQAVYDAWLDSAAHGAMTGGAAKSPALGGPYSAWDGYITGKTLELIPGKRIVQSWRTSEFGAGDPDSTITVYLEPTKGGARLTLTHSGVPDGQTSYENGGWQDNYFTPRSLLPVGKVWGETGQGFGRQGLPNLSPHREMSALSEAEPAGGGALAHNSIHFARALREAGVPLGPGAVLDALAAVEAGASAIARTFTRRCMRSSSKSMSTACCSTRRSASSGSARVSSRS